MARFLAVVLFTTSAFAQSITSITPSSGPVTGGTTVTIRGSGFSDSCSLASCYASFDYVPALMAKFIDDNTVVAVTPPHPPGPAMVFSAGRVTTFTYEGDPGEVFDAVLLPIFVPLTAGANGSQFFTTFSIWSIAGPDIVVFGIGIGCHGIVDCPPEPNVLTTILRARQGSAERFLRPTGDPGAVIWMPKGSYERIAASLRVADNSRYQDSFGTRIPIVPGREFRSDIVVLLDVAVLGSFRDMLRVYSLDPQTSVHVRVIRSDSPRIDQEFDLDLRDPPDVYHPGYAQFSGFVMEDNVRIEVESLTPGKRIWAFVSVTNNETQQITVVAPH